MKPLKRVVIKEELVELTGDFRPALILNQFIYWIEKMYDTDKYILEEKERALKHDMEVSIDESKGWIYKTAEELNEELMIGMSVPTIRKYINQYEEKRQALLDSGENKLILTEDIVEPPKYDTRNRTKFNWKKKD